MIPSSFWGFTVIESASSMPATRLRWCSLRANTAPMAPSTCSHTSWRRQIGARASRGSTAPRTVVPAVATTAITGTPCCRRVSSWWARAAGSMPPAAVVGMGWRAEAGRPITARALPIDTWASALASTTASPLQPRPRSRRAVTRAIRLERVPPLAGTPPLPVGMPRLSASQAIRLRSSRLRLGESSSASRLLFRPAQIRSPTIDAANGGGSRWARAPGWPGL